MVTILLIEIMVSKVNYEVPFKHRKHFTPEECVSLSNAFRNYDKDKNGTINSAEFK